MTTSQVAALFGVWAVAVASPGPDLAVVLQRALAGRRHGVAAAVGVVAGITVWIVAAFAGLAALVGVQPGLMTVLQVAGGGLLATLGALGLRGWWRVRGRGDDDEGRSCSDDGNGDAAADPGSAPASARGDLLRGLATNLANPKALVFFGAILTPFLTGEVSAGASVLLVAGMVAVAFAWFCGLALAASHPRVYRRIGRALPWIDLVVSGLFVVLGAVFAGAALLGR
ncbi:LysE family translocator [Dietzia sp. 179-F 9C3 NHS]|uniref:LysE family translocator n=1 Tax=Dietzia sp. 179-F 9C3 NHS TaxID=3374295 RepID=UPI00387A6CFF